MVTKTVEETIDKIEETEPIEVVVNPKLYEILGIPSPHPIQMKKEDINSSIQSENSFLKNYIALLESKIPLGQSLSPNSGLTNREKTLITLFIFHCMGINLKNEKRTDLAVIIERIFGGNKEKYRQVISGIKKANKSELKKELDKLLNTIDFRFDDNKKAIEILKKQMLENISTLPENLDKDK